MEQIRLAAGNTEPEQFWMLRQSTLQWLGNDGLHIDRSWVE